MPGMKDDERIWSIIEKCFRDNPQALVNHHIDSYNDFFNRGIFQVFREINPITIVSKLSEESGEYKRQCNLYLGGKDGKRIYFGKPTIHDAKYNHYMFPNEARLRNMTYAMTVHYDMEVEFIDDVTDINDASIVSEEFLRLRALGEIELVDVLDVSKMDKSKNLYVMDDDQKWKQVLGSTAVISKLRSDRDETMSAQSNKQIRSIVLEKILLGRFPIMVQSDMCILHGMTRENRWSMGECRNDPGGYFIIDGKEKVVICQEKLADNMLNIRTFHATTTEDDTPVEPEFACSVEIKSISENTSKPRRTLSMALVSPTSTSSNKHIVVNIPNVRKPIPLFVLFRALGIISDHDIIEMCLLDMVKYEKMIDLFVPSVHDTSSILSQQAAITFIAHLTKGKKTAHVHEVLTDYLLPHVGEGNYIQKAYFLGYMAFRMLSVYTGQEVPTDRDNFKCKRVETTGALIHDLFREYMNIQKKQYHLEFEKRHYFNAQLYEDHLDNLVLNNYKEICGHLVVETGFRKAFKGNWGSVAHTKRIGVVQDMNRLSFNSMISHMRKVCLPLDSSLKVVKPRQLHASQWGYIDPLDTPDGGNIGFHKSLSIATIVSRECPRDSMIKWMKENLADGGLYLLDNGYLPRHLAPLCKLLVNGLWIGCIADPLQAIATMKLHRRNALLPVSSSFAFDSRQNTVFIYVDGGRLCRPLFYVDAKAKVSYQRIEDAGWSWNDLICGSNTRHNKNFDPYAGQIYDMKDLYVMEDRTVDIKATMLEKFTKHGAIIDYSDCNEEENMLIAINHHVFQLEDSSKLPKYTHCEIHESLIFGAMCNMIVYPEHNPAPRNLFSCGQSKQACSIYHSNYQVRMDKSALILNYGQTPLVKSRYLDWINREEHPYGENAMVAIMCYTGYNVEDAILINEGALKRGLFRTTYINVYETHEEHVMGGDNGDEWIDTTLANPANRSDVKLRAGLNYDKLDQNGLIREGSIVDEDTVLIGMITGSGMGDESDLSQMKKDVSITPKKGQQGVVEKVYVTDGEIGQRIIKVRVMDQRIPAMGDKFASRVGQKGTVGRVIPECDMPFTKDGMIPDILVNPHALPTRMTVGQLLESVTGKACAMYGAFGDCTAFGQCGSKVKTFGKMLTEPYDPADASKGTYLTNGAFHSSGNEILYNGMTGEQIKAEIFVGPTYYMRLKHMVKDKINYRRKGPNDQLTRQPVGGRANDGGLRIGEMEKDALASYGATEFLRESLMERGDNYKVAICNRTGMIAVYNEDQNLFLSPSADGPLKFHLDEGLKYYTEGSIRPEKMTRFGRDFSIVKIPYAMKLLIQELQTMNIHMRVITEENIQQLESMMGTPMTSNISHKESNTKSIYGWIEEYDARKIRARFWVKVTTNEILYNEPQILLDRKFILNMKVSDTYVEGDKIYYLYGTEKTDDPNKEWTIKTIYKDKNLMKLVGEFDVIERAVYDINVMRMVNPQNEMRATEEVVLEEEEKKGEEEEEEFTVLGGRGKREDQLQEKMDPNFKEGSMVYWKLDTKIHPHRRMWYIMELDDGKVKIATEDEDGITKADDMVKYVVPSDIELIPATDLYSMSEGQVQPEQVPIPPQVPNITFAPIIKVINGNDNSTPNQEATTEATQANFTPNEHNVKIPFLPYKNTLPLVEEESKEAANSNLLGAMSKMAGIVVKKLTS